MPDRREILEQVAAGTLTPEEAESLLAGDDAPPTQTASPQDPSAVRRLRVTGGFGAISIVGDPTVAQAEVDGMHEAVVDDDTLTIRSDRVPGEHIPPGAFAFSIGRARMRKRIRIHEVHAGGKRHGALAIRVNPNLDIDVRLDAGPIEISEVKGKIRARTGAGPITVEGSESELDVAVNAGAIRVVGKLTDGDSRIRSDAGAVKVVLHPDSNVQIHAQAAIGKVVLPGNEGAGTKFVQSREATVGSGDASLRVETAMGSIQIALG